MFLQLPPLIVILVPTRRAFTVAAALLAVTPCAWAQRNPFPHATTAPATPAAASPAAQILELNGVIANGEQTLVCITTVANRRSHWIKVGEKADGIRVISHDAATNAVAVEYDNRQLSLALKQPAAPSPGSRGN